MLYQLSYASARRGIRLGQDREGIPACQAASFAGGIALRPSSASEKAAEDSTDRVGLIRRSWLPLPEKAVNDRVLLHHLPGFVDRAY
jgi:hypothetical protein